METVFNNFRKTGGRISYGIYPPAPAHGVQLAGWRMQDQAPDEAIEGIKHDLLRRN